MDSGLQNAGYQFNLLDQKWETGDLGADILYFGSYPQDIPLSSNTLSLYDSGTWELLPHVDNQFPLFDHETYNSSKSKHSLVNFVRINASLPIESLPDDETIIWVLSSNNTHRLAEQRKFILELMRHGRNQPVVLFNDYKALSRTSLLLKASAEMGGILNDGLADGVWINSASISLSESNEIAFGILQASRSRITKTEYIACPSCGRTLFDLEEVTAQIRSRTAHLKGLKIGIMGCIVNGPGEMADADFGYVGTGPGKISLYQGQEVVRPHIPQSEAVDALIDLIKSEGSWVDP